MKNDRLTTMEQYIISHEKVTIQQLQERFGISINTLRSDLDILEKRGTVAKIYGGAVAQNIATLTSMPRRFEQNMQIKRRIGELAAGMIPDNATVYIDSGSTTTNIIPYLGARAGLTLVTNSLPAINEATRLGNVNIVTLGGIYNASVGAFVGVSVFEALRNLSVNIAVMAATGVSVKNGLSNTTYFEAEIKRLVTMNCQKIVLMADHTKFGHDAMISYCPLSKVSTVVTDTAPSAEFLDFFESSGIRIIY